MKRRTGADAYNFMSSTKSATGHLLARPHGAIYAIKSMNDQIVPPTLNPDEPTEGCDIDRAKQAKQRVALRAQLVRLRRNASLIVGPVTAAGLKCSASPDPVLHRSFCSAARCSSVTGAGLRGTARASKRVVILRGAGLDDG